MAGQEDLSKVRDKTDKAKDYFSRIPGFQAPTFEKPAPEPEPAPEPLVPARPAKPEAPLSEAEKYFKKILGK